MMIAVEKHFPTLKYIGIMYALLQAQGNAGKKRDLARRPLTSGVSTVESGQRY